MRAVEDSAAQEERNEREANASVRDGGKGERREAFSLEREEISEIFDITTVRRNRPSRNRSKLILKQSFGLERFASSW